MAAWFAAHTPAEIEATFDEHDLPFAPILDANGILADAHYAAREAIVTVDHPVFGPIRMQNAFPKLSETPGEVRWPGPDLGAHTEAVLTEKLGYSAERLDSLRATGVI